MRTLLRTTAAAFVAISLFGCTDESDPISTAADARPSRYEGKSGEPLISASNGDIALLDVQVRGPELKSTLRYQIPLTGGGSARPLSLPVGKKYDVEVRGHDRYGTQTFEGKSSLKSVALGEMESLKVDLFPVGKGERASATFGVVGEERAPAGLQIYVELDRKEVPEGETARLNAYGVDPKGNRIELDPGKLNWSIEDPRLGRFGPDPLKPRDPDDFRNFLAHRIPPEFRRPADLTLTFLDLVVVTVILIVPNPYVELSAGSEVTCGIRNFGTLSCWGSNASLMLGIGNTRAPDRCKPSASVTLDCSVRPMAVSGGRSFSSVSVGTGHVCAIERSTAAAFCWGSNSHGQLGVTRAAATQSSAPVAVAPPAGSSTPLAFRSISAGLAITCGVTTAGAEFCWGSGFGEAPVAGAAVATGSTAAHGFSCHMDTIGIWCDGPPFPRSQAFGWSFLGQATTASHVCAISTNTSVWCWGDSGSGKLGNGTTVDGRTQVVAPAALTTVAAGQNHSCGLAGTTAFCWGSNYSGELGINSQSAGSSTPQQVTNGATTPAWSKISTGAAHTCAIDAVGEIWCWGTNYLGQLGMGGKFDYNANLPRQAIFAPVRTVGL